MSEILAIIVLFILVFGGAIGCGIKALLGKSQSAYLPKRFADELKMENSISCMDIEENCN